MAKYDVTYACGHTGTVELYGKSADREKRLAYLATVTCSACRKADNLDTYSADLANGYCELQGSEKQIAWAASIRHDMVAKLLEKREQVLDNAPAVQALDNIIDAAVTRLPQSKWWIDNARGTRNSFIFAMFNAFPCLKEGKPVE